MKILGIEPGYGRMGFGCIETQGTGWSCLGVGVLTSPKGEKFERRLSDLQKDLEALLNEFNPDIMAVEKLFFAQNTTTAMRVAEARGVALCAAGTRGIEVRELTPAQVKKAVTGNGRADKRTIQMMVKTLLGLPRAPRPDDAADALAIALAASSALVSKS